MNPDQKPQLSQFVFGEVDKKIQALKGNFTKEQFTEFSQKAEKIGMAAVKYFDLKQNRINNYVFKYEKMLDPKGDSAVYLLYTYARICSILKKSKLQEEDLAAAAEKHEFRFSHPHELVLIKKIAQFPDVLDIVIK